jgi:hypothetical protein
MLAEDFGDQRLIVDDQNPLRLTVGHWSPSVIGSR